MTLLLPVIISSILGYLVVNIFNKERRPLTMLDFFLIPYLGLGLSSQLIFYSLLIFNCISPQCIILAHALCLMGLYGFHKINKIRFQSFAGPIRNYFWTIILLGIVAVIAYSWAIQRPYGDWDAWSYWNYRAKFLFTAGYEWKHMFEFNIQGHHPLMLPLMIIWGWIGGGQSIVTPIAIAIFFMVGCAGVLISALSKYMKFSTAFLAGLYLCSIPFYMYHATSQYADIIVAYFILAFIVLYLEFFEEPSFLKAVLMGLCLGLNAYTKQNGIVASLMFFFLAIPLLIKDKQRYRFLKPLVWSIALIGVSIVIIRFFDLLDIQNKEFSGSIFYLLDCHRWALVGTTTLDLMLSPQWGGLWLMAGVLSFFWLKRLNHKHERLIPLFIILHIIFYLFVYVVSQNDLKWFMEVTWNRLIFFVAPSLIFIMFYALGKKELR